MKIKKSAKKRGRPIAKEKRIKALYGLRRDVKEKAAKIAFSLNISASRYIENLILADIQRITKESA